ncbi:ATP-NAD/AcoX kinase [Nitzschia inconspicua]|uniref:ATP-NAD/AcoX kinase n=1 Tax=Nitzschia inconspicua TaxID=303405 RepID=A0A9K3M459_9STRA|nr:ATP-NAD/AcoX kinase [Nitzschia inconspicua]
MSRRSISYSSRHLDTTCLYHDEIRSFKRRRPLVSDSLNKLEEREDNHTILTSKTITVVTSARPTSFLKETKGRHRTPWNHALFLLISIWIIWPAASFSPTTNSPMLMTQQARDQYRNSKSRRFSVSSNSDSFNGSSNDPLSIPEDKAASKEEKGGDIILEKSDSELPLIKRIPSLLNRNSSSSTFTADSTKTSTTASPPPRKMNLMWCQSDRCVDVVRERVIGEHNQIMLNGPATGQVAYRWDQNTSPGLVKEFTKSETNKVPPKTTLSSVLLLVRRGDENLLRIAAENVPKLTQIGINVLLAPDLSAKLKHYYGVDDPLISLFEEPKDPNVDKWRVRYMDDEEEEWFEDMKYVEPFPDLVVTLGGDGLLIYASMLFQGPVPPLLAISGGSLGFLTPFAENEMVDAVKTALGIKAETTNGDDALSSSLIASQADELQVFPPNMPSYPYEPLVKMPHSNNGTPRFKFGLGDFICLTIRMRLDCRVVNRDGVVRARYNVLNEVVIDRGSSPYLAALECFCDDVHLTTVQADGVIFATPTGSTAYSMAAGGSVVHPAVPCIMVTPICPHVLSFRSMVFPDHVVLRCYVPDDARSTAAVAFDGKHRRELQRGDSVQIQMSAYPVPTIDRGDHSSDWLESLKRSFNFNTRPRQRPL